jgi:hypothetical protein
MSTTTTPLSPFICTASNPSVVYYLDNNLARLVPDAATLAYMEQGQTVRTLSDADFAAIKQGTPLPSRADNTLLQIDAPTAFGQVDAFIMQGGYKRGIGDLQTLHLFEAMFAQAKVITPADAAEIPSGAPMPSRADGTAYQGSAAAYAFLLNGGKKSAVPDATTLRDAGHDPSTAQPIAAQDLAAIPDGPALPSTSRFLHPPSAAVPLLLLPMRLETRFQNNELWLRVFPDDIHVNSFEPELTADESSTRTAYLAAAAQGGQAAQDAFTALAQQYGPQRAAWIASANAQAGSKAASWTKAPSTNVLPERWLVMGYQGTAAGQLLAIGSPIADSLAVGPDPNGPGSSTDPGMQWLTDFDQAVQAGMGIRIPLTGTQTSGFTRIVVFGLNTQITPVEAVTRFGDLLQAHHYTDGLEFLPHGAPINNSGNTSSALSSHDPNYAKLYALEQGPALCPSRPTADGDRLARALGIDPSLFAHISGADGGQDGHAFAMNTVLWPATLGYYLEQIVTGSVPTPDVLLPIARSHFIDYVRARGHYPILRSGTQPYGVLPVQWSAQWKGLENRALDAPLMSLLANLRTTWENSIANVPQIPGSADPEAALVNILGMQPRSASYSARSVIGPEYTLTYWRFVQQDPGQTWWTALSAKTTAEAGTLSTAMFNTRLVSATFVNTQRLLTDVLVAPAPLDGVAAPSYIAQLAATSTWEALRDIAMPAQPVPLLFLFLRHAALRQYLDTAAELLAQETPTGIQPSERIEPELVGLSAGLARPTPWDILGRTLTGKGVVGTYLDASRTDTSIPDFAAFWSAFQTLTTLSAESLDAAAREAMDLASYRLDAWLSSMAQFRLDQLRTATPNGGLVLGAYAWLENVVPGTAVASEGYIHAPSLAHATTAAVLRSAYLTHKGAAQSPLELTLSSSRVRLAMHLLDGMRQGQPLGALLGYRLERTMHDNGLETLITSLRAIAPLNATTDTSTTTSTFVAANNVVDGLALLRTIFVNNTLATGNGLPTDSATRDKLTSALQTLTDALDSVADVTLAESVHQLLRGNAVRSGATLDAIARGDTPPPEIDVVQTPRSGTAFTHRLFTIAGGTAAAGWANTPRAQAEPRLNAWASAMLPAPAIVHARASFSDSTGAVSSTIEFGIDTLGISPLDLLALPETAGLSGELGARLLRAAAAARPASVAAAATITLLDGRDSSWPATTIAVTELLELVASLDRLVSGSRAITPDDLIFPGDTAESIDTVELRTRADAAEAQVRAAVAPLEATTGLDTALMTAANFGAANAVPSLDSTQWASQAAAAVTVLNTCIAALDQLASGFTRTGASADTVRAHDVSRLQTIFGQPFLVLPALDATISGRWMQFWSNSLSLQGNDAFAATTWLQRMARIRPGVSRLHQAILYGESLTGTTLSALSVAQLPQTSGDRWVALPNPNVTSSRLSLVAFAPQAPAAGAEIAGLTVDEWIEVMPSPQQITGISFHQDDPTARAPQTLLLAVRPDSFPEWTLESLEGTVLEALGLAKIRAVDIDALSSLGHYLPALYFAHNAGGPQVEAISTDFNLARAASVIKAQ